MSHQVTIPIGANGIIDPDEQIQDIIAKAMSATFATTDVFIYSHGWWTTADSALKEYNVATTDFSYFLRQQNPQVLKQPATCPLSFGIHWPSVWDDDPTALANQLEALSFYTMEKRAEDIGEEGVYAILRLLLAAVAPGKTIRIHLFGHSFGCKVICAALEQLAENGIALPAGVTLNVILLQAAFSTSSLDNGQTFGSVIPAFGSSMRMLVTKSNADNALGVAFPVAHATNFFLAGRALTALGATGPTATTVNLFPTNQAMAVAYGSTFLGRLPSPSQASVLVVADLTPVHSDPRNTYNGGWGGHHSDIFRPEIYDLMAWFLFG